MLEAGQECVLRLVTDDRMRDVYTRLVKVALVDSQHVDFFVAGCEARIDSLDKRREALKAVENQREKVAKVAEKLADLLKEMNIYGLPWYPPEFLSLQALLQSCESWGRHMDPMPGKP